MQVVAFRSDTLTPMGTAHLAAARAFAPWKLREQDYPLHGSLREKLRFLLRYAILAPSTYNSQPWQFGIGNDSVDVLSDLDRALPVVDPDRRELLMSCGAVACLLRAAAANFGFATTLAAFPDPADANLAARVRVSRTLAPRAEHRALFRAITTRRRNVLCFDSASPSAPLLAALSDRAGYPGVRMAYLDDPAKEEAVRLIAEADRLQMSDRAFHAELAQWTSERGNSRADGLPRDWHQGTSCLPDFGAPVWSEAIGSVGPEEYHAARVKQRVGSPPLLAVLGTDTDTPAAWVAAGEALLDAELHARAAGVWFTDFNQPVQLPEFRKRLGRLSGVAFPQTLVRIGYGVEVAPTPRRDLEDMLIRQPGRQPSTSVAKNTSIASGAT